MPTVPTWIADAVAVQISFGHPGDSAYRVKSWRATKTRVMVTLEGYRSKNEVAFRLDDLGQIGQPKYKALYLFPPDHEHVIAATRKQTVRRAVASVKSVLHSTRLDPSRMSADRLVEVLDELMRVTSQAIRDIASTTED